MLFTFILIKSPFFNVFAIFTLTLAVLPLLVDAVIVVVPIPTPFIIPVSLIVAISSFELTHFRLLSVALSGNTFTFSCNVLFISNSTSLGDTETLLTLTSPAFPTTALPLSYVTG